MQINLISLPISISNQVATWLELIRILIEQAVNVNCVMQSNVT